MVAGLAASDEIEAAMHIISGVFGIAGPFALLQPEPGTSNPKRIASSRTAASMSASDLNLMQ
jgi:hypothetical protein